METSKESYIYGEGTSLMAIISDDENFINERPERKNKEIEVVPEKDYFVFSKRNNSDKIECLADFNKLKAPIRKGDKVGEISIFKNDVLVGTVNVLAREDSLKMNYLDYVKDISNRWAL